MEQGVFFTEEFERLKQALGNKNAEEVFVVRANKSFKPSGAEAFVLSLLVGANYTSFFEFDPNPQVEDLKKGLALFKQKKYSLIIAIGGGSVLDMAKLISVFAHQKASVEDLVEGRAEILNLKTPLLAVPTTSGTGAEATHFSVLYMGKKKFSVASPAILPNNVYLSPDFSNTANAYLTACTGLDAFCQAVESVWSVNANDLSEQWALEAIALIWKNLHAAVHNNLPSAKKAMLQAAFLAGKAINITKTTAPHAISYAFSSYYGLPHGHAVAISLPFFIDYNYKLNDIDCADSRGAVKVKQRIINLLAVLGLSAEEAKHKVIDFIQALGVEMNISKLISEFDENVIIDNVNTERLSTNPRQVSKLTVKAMLLERL